MYFAPNGNGFSGVTARFDAKQPAALPRLCSKAAALYCFSGSFLLSKRCSIGGYGNWAI
jgi:hypothetical protein